MIEIVEEPPAIQREFGGLMEDCTFCRTPTRFWDAATRKRPVCPTCARTEHLSKTTESKAMTKELPNPLVAEVMKLVNAYAIGLFGFDNKHDERYVAVESRLTELLAQREAVAWQGGLSNEQLRAAWDSKLPGVEPRDHELAAFALGVEVGRALTPLLETKES